jgi:hypothetical protein
VTLPYAGLRVRDDLPAELCAHSHSETLMLATYLLNARDAQIILPVHDLRLQQKLPLPGQSFWFVHG